MAKELTRDFFIKAGRKGGKAVYKKRGKKYMQGLAKKANAVRWGKKKPN